MYLNELYQLSKALNSGEKKKWLDKFIRDYNYPLDFSDGFEFEQLIAALYAKKTGWSMGASSEIIGYGAGSIAKEYLPRLRHVGISRVWDAYTCAEAICGFPIAKPDFCTISPETKVIILIEDRAVQFEITSRFEAAGVKAISTYTDFLLIDEAVRKLPALTDALSCNADEYLDSFIGQYMHIEDDNAAVNYSFIKKDYGNIDFSIDSTCVDDIVNCLAEQLIFCDIDITVVKEAVCDLAASADNILSFAYKLETMLRVILANGAKTKERPISMQNDTPYDKFAVFTAVFTVIEAISATSQAALVISRHLSAISGTSIPLIAVECRFLVQSFQLEAALALARAAMHLEPNSLLANETFYITAVQAKQHGINVQEPLPDYDLSERFCWSGLTFALCSGFDKRENSAEFLPCFRTLQCAATPKGTFWNGDEWREFRKSVIDGSFKYCQKNQCSNIVAGWLPMKKDCDIEALAASPKLEELHLSYDFHCNLKCPSCRREIKTNTAQENMALDELAEKNLGPLIKNAKHICLSGCGEAILSPHSRGLIKAWSSEEYPELNAELRTNVFTLSEKAWSALGKGREVIKHIAASIDAASKDTFERLRCPAKWETVLENLAFIKLLRDTEQLDLFEIHTVIQAGNLDELVDIVNMAIQYNADVITFSRLVNWSEMSEKEYFDINPFWVEHPEHSKLLRVINEIIQIRADILADNYELAIGKRKLMINMHFIPDPDPSYKKIRVGRLKVR